MKAIFFIILTVPAFFLLSACQGDQIEEPRVQDRGLEETEEERTELEAGIFTAYSDTDDNGYARARVRIEGNDIVEVELMEILPTGNEKDYKSYQYEPVVKAYEEMPGRFEKADSADVDVYTGATRTSEKFKQAVRRALDYAEGKSEGRYYDGRFQGESERTESGYAVALVTIKDDEIQKVELKEIDGEGEWRDFSEYNWEPAVMANKEMAESFVEANSPEVDLYTNATQSSIRYKEAVRNALHHASKNPEKE